MSGTINRRSFLKMMGWSGAGAALTGCDLPTTVTLEEGKEDVVSYLMPEEYVIPGVGVWYASICTQCAGGCGTHGRVREGRVLKMEGNPVSSVNKGKLCMMGQAGVQGHYNPDRITEPMIRKNGSLTRVSWDQALATIQEKIAASGGKVAWFTGTVSGHQKALLDNHLEAVGSKSHYSHEVINTTVWQTVSKDMLGDATPLLRIDKADVVLSFGADFLGSWMSSPVRFATDYAKFRSNRERGMLVQIEPKMTLTGGNADLWIASKPGSEGLVALAIANELITTYSKDSSILSAESVDLIKKNDAVTVSKATGIDATKIEKLAGLLARKKNPLILAGASAEGHANGYAAVSAIMTLNLLLGSIGKTIEASGAFPFAQLEAKQGNTGDLLQFVDAVKDNKLDVVFFYGSNPSYSAPSALGMDAAMKNIGLKVAISQFNDETTAMADVVLPAASYLEDWGTHVIANQPEQNLIGMQQPLMEKLYENTKGLGDILLSLLKQAKKDEYTQYADYYAYLRHAFSSMPKSYKADPESDDNSWNSVLQNGVINVETTEQSLSTAKVKLEAPDMAKDDSAFPLHLVPSARLGLWDGRHANLPWLQEAPDQISKVVWDSWAELHPTTAKKMGIKAGNIIKVESKNGEVKLKAILLKSMHPDAIAVPMGQGHTEYGRYATGLGVNPLKILGLETESKTGELAMYATRVKVSKTGDKDVVVKMGGSDTQMGRKFVVTIPVDQLRRTEGV